MKKWSLALAVLILILAPWAAYADYPDQPITFVCPFPAGGDTDAIARMLAALVQKDLGVPVNVVNRTGGNGAVGHQTIFSARPDGYTIGIGTAELAIFHWMGLAKFTAADYTPICGVNVDPAVITVPPDSRWKDYAALMEDVKVNKGKYTSSGAAVGGICHFALLSWLVGAGLPADQVSWTPSTGSVSAQQEMVAGGVNMVTCSLAEVAALVEAGKARILVSMGAERNPKFPDVPTLRELGVPVSAGTWRGISGPKGIPAGVLKKLEDSFAKVVARKDFVDFMNSRGLAIHFLPSKEWGEFMLKADEEFGAVMKKAGFVQSNSSF